MPSPPPPPPRTPRSPQRGVAASEQPACLYKDLRPAAACLKTSRSRFAQAHAAPKHRARKVLCTDTVLLAPQLLSMDVRTYLYKIKMYLYIEGSRGHAWRNALQIYKHQPPNQGCSVLDPRWCRAFRWCQPSDANCLTQQCSAEARQSRRDY